MKLFYVLFLIGSGVLTFVVSMQHEWPLWASLVCAIGTPLITHALVVRSERSGQ